MTKKTIIAIWILFLIISVPLGSSKIINDKAITTTNYNDTDVPIWNIGDSWTYDAEFRGSYPSTTFSIALHDLLFQVEDETSVGYKLSFVADVTGELNVEDADVSGTFRDTTAEGNMVIKQSDLGIKSIDVTIEGRILVELIPVPILIDFTATFDPAFSTLVFPLTIGKQWSIPHSDVTIQGSLSLLGVIEIPLDSTDWVGGGNAECISSESITVEAGTYEAYKIHSTLDISEQYYAQAAGNIIKELGEGYYLDSIDIELKSTTYSGGEPGKPNKPSKPSGSTSGKRDETYEYSSSTTDNEGDQIYYLFSWGDGTDSGWLGPKNSGETCKASHKWSSEGSFQVKVKAKDTEEHVSVWSDSLTVSISKSKNTKSYLTRFLENLIERFPAMARLLEFPLLEKLLNLQ